MSEIFSSEREMSISHEEFMRVLPKALAGRPFRKTGSTVDVSLDNGRFCIHLGAQWERKLAALRLPVIRVRLEISGVDVAEREALLRRFDRAFQRGGG